MPYSNLLNKIREKGAEFADLRLLDQNAETISVEDGKINLLQKNNVTQYGVRVFYKGAWGFSFGNDPKQIGPSFDHALKLAKVSSKKIPERFEIQQFQTDKTKIILKKKSFMDVDIKDKIKTLFDCDKLIRDKYVINRRVDAAFLRRHMKYYNTSDADIDETREYFNFLFNAVGKKDGHTRRVFDKTGMCTGYEDFENLNFENIISTELKKFPMLFKARKAPAGKYPLVIDNVLCNVFFHEAVGHACEADSILENSSVLKGKMNKEIAPDFLTLADDPLIRKEHGFYSYDDEGVRADETVLIKNGVLTNYLHSIETASKMNAKPTGNCRSEDAVSFPYPRMSNTVVYPQDYKVEELFEGIHKGIYAKNSTGGIVEPGNGNFLFNTKEAWLIEDGKISKPVLDVSFGGNILTTLMNIEMIAKDTKTLFGGWRCGKKGQTVPVGGQSPHIKISEAIVGGQND